MGRKRRFVAFYETKVVGSFCRERGGWGLGLASAEGFLPFLVSPGVYALRRRSRELPLRRQLELLREEEQLIAPDKRGLGRATWGLS